MTKAKIRLGGAVLVDRLLSFIERVENLEEERKAISGDVRDVYSEAKGVGYDVKTMRKIVQERRQDAADRDEQEALLEIYRRALGMPGATYRGVAAQVGLTKSKLHRLVPNDARGTGTDPAPETPARDGTGTSDKPDAPGSAVASLSEPLEPRVAAPDSIDDDPWERVGAIPDRLRRAPSRSMKENSTNESS